MHIFHKRSSQTLWLYIFSLSTFFLKKKVDQLNDVLGITAGVKLFYINVSFETQLSHKASQIELVKFQRIPETTHCFFFACGRKTKLMLFILETFPQHLLPLLFMTFCVRGGGSWFQMSHRIPCSWFIRAKSVQRIQPNHA